MISMIQRTNKSPCRNFKLLRLVLTVLGLAAVSNATANEPYLPASEDTVVAKLKPAVVALSRKIQELDARAAQPSWGEGERVDFLKEVLAAYNLATEQGSARAYGYTLALASRWPADLEPPPLLRLIRASLLQRNHEFAKAEVELQAILVADPDNLEALVSLAQIGLVTGEYENVQRYCDRLAQLPYFLSALNCQAQLDALTGKATHALQSAESALALPSLPSADALELHITAATIAHRLGENNRAEHHYQQSLLLGGESNFLILNYAEWLLEMDRPAQALDLLAGPINQEDQFEMKVLYLNALETLGEAGLAQGFAAGLAAEIERLSKRGDDVPLKVIARYALSIESDAQKALVAARENWRKQKEPGDALLLSQSAVAANDKQTLAALKAWRAGTGLEDVRLDRVLSEGEFAQ